MTRTRYRFIPGDSAPYFITATTVNWLPLFSSTEIVKIVLDSLQFLIDHQRLVLHAYIIMENHLHLVANADDLTKEIGDFKSFSARKCIDYFLSNQNQMILDQLAAFKLKHKGDPQYQFWQEGSHPERMSDEQMLLQKIDYIHYNPIRRGYVDLPEHWRYSSARDYAGLKGLLPIEMIG